MIFPDLIFIATVLGLPVVVSFRLFQTEPSGRPFLATFALAVFGSSILFTIAALVLMVSGVGGLGPFDGVFEFIVSVPVALIIGLVVRGRRKRAVL